MTMCVSPFSSTIVTIIINSPSFDDAKRLTERNENNFQLLFIDVECLRNKKAQTNTKPKKQEENNWIDQLFS